MSGLTITGNDLDNALNGSSGSDTINGGAGDDYISGQAGNDELRGNQGFDTISAGTGDDTIWGGQDVDLIQGRYGNDVLWGMASDDRFWFDHAAAADADTIMDFTLTADKIELATVGFSSLAALAGGALPSANYRAAAAVSAQTSTQHVLYDTGSGDLYYDADGSGAGAMELIATLSTKPALAAGDILLL